MQSGDRSIDREIYGVKVKDHLPGTEPSEVFKRHQLEAKVARTRQVDFIDFIATRSQASLPQ